MKKEQFEKFKAEVKPGDILYISSDSWINKLIVAGQETRDPAWTNQLGHAAFVDADMNIQESAIDKYHGKLCSGILIRPLDEWKDYKRIKWFIIQRLDGMTAEKLKIMTEKGKFLQNKRLYYPVQELAGTLISNLAYKFLSVFKWINRKGIDQTQKKLLAKNNIFDTDKGMYCIAFVNHCANAAGLPLLPEGINESKCVVGEGLRGKLAYTLKFIVPGIFKDYRKEAGQDFDLDPKE